MKAKISGTGSYLPQTILTNHQLEERIDTSDTWIQQRVGIKQRYIASEQETNLYMSLAAAKNALAAAKVSPQAIDLIIVATSTPDNIMPSVAVQVQSELDIPSCPAFDVSAACAGFMYALGIAEQFIAAGTAKQVLLIGTELMSRVIDWDDRSTCVLFGDGAGAVVISASKQPGIIATHLHADGHHKSLLHIPNNLDPATSEKAQIPRYLKMQGNKVFRYAVEMLDSVAEEVLQANNISSAEIDWLVPHQANERIIRASAKRLNIPMEKVIMTLAEHGNTSSASVPLALDAAVKDNRIKPGDLILLEAFGSGFVWAASLIRF